tara:strand:+ start:15293 stop:15991 length:699 start_codon:yes stop_codon:yes gene_type:complete
MDKFNNRGLYALIYPPKLVDGINWKDIKIGKTSKTFKDRFKGYQGPLKITNCTGVLLLDLDAEKCSRNFCEEEKVLKMALFEMAKAAPYNMMPLSARKSGEWYQVKHTFSDAVVEKVFDVFMDIKNNQKVPHPRSANPIPIVPREQIVVTCPTCKSENRHGVGDGWRTCDEIQIVNGSRQPVPNGCSGYYVENGQPTLPETVDLTSSSTDDKPAPAPKPVGIIGIFDRFLFR